MEQEKQENLSAEEMELQAIQADPQTGKYYIRGHKTRGREVMLSLIDKEECDIVTEISEDLFPIYGSEEDYIYYVEMIEDNVGEITRVPATIFNPKGKIEIILPPQD